MIGEVTDNKDVNEILVSDPCLSLLSGDNLYIITKYACYFKLSS